MNKTPTPRTVEDVAPDAIEVWVCPNCQSTWHSSTIPGNLNAVPNIRTAMRNDAHEDPSNWGSVTGHRGDCQICKDSSEARENGGPFQRQHVLYIKASRVAQG